MNAFVQDLRFGIRVLAASPGFTAAATLSLGLAIGAVACVYSLGAQVFWRPLPFDDPDSIRSIWMLNETRGSMDSSLSYPTLADFQERNEVFEGICGFTAMGQNMMGPDGPERVNGGVVTSSFFPLLRAQPLIGRTFLPEEDRSGAERVVILSERMWERQFDRRETVLSETLTLDRKPYTIVGVMPRNFLFLETGNVDLWVNVPAFPLPSQWRENNWLETLARLKPGVSDEEADANLRSISNALAEEYPDYLAGRRAITRPMGLISSAELATQYLILFGSVGFVLLLACVNVANLLLARMANRRKEITVRIAMGASRRRLIRQLLTESMILASLGGGAGILVSYWGIDFIISLLPAEEADFYVRYFRFGVDAAVIETTMLVALGSALLFGLLPAVQASKPDINECLKEGGGAGSGVLHSRLLASLVVAQVSLALILLTASGLLIRSFLVLQNQDPGLNPRNLIAIDLHQPRSKDGKALPGQDFFPRLYDRLSTQGGFEAAALTSVLPYQGANSGSTILIEGRPAPAPGEFEYAGHRAVSPHYFETLQIPLLQGRDFGPQDQADTVPTVIVNEKMAAAFWPGEDPIGKRLRLSFQEPGDPWKEIVGVVGNVYHQGLDQPYLPEMFVPFSQSLSGKMTVVARTQGDPYAAIPTIRRLVAEVDPQIPISSAMSMEQIMYTALWQRRFTTILFTILAAVALTLSAIGVYGVINYSVSQRTHEIGIRMALGAQAADVRWLVVRKGLVLALIGVVLGLPLAVALSFVLAGMLYGISHFDPLTFAGVAFLLLLVAASASYLPARRATRVDPMIALRYE
ncbi:MAG: ABC transporter permease [Candidatus Hydrogenedentes bacterium]|nr:ABC transporter permease [Candidatus Hydrogenedentota bacterium]